MQRRENNKRKPHAEVVDLEDLAARKREYHNAQQLRDRNAAEHAPPYLGQRRPCTEIATAERDAWDYDLAAALGAALEADWRAGRGHSEAAAGAAVEEARGWKLEGARDVGAEFHGDADADDEVDERDGVEGDVCEGHGAADVDERHDYSYGNDEGGADAAEEDGADEEADGDGGADEGHRQLDDRGVLVEEDVEFGVGEDGEAIILSFDIGRDAACGCVGSDEVGLGAKRSV